MWLPKIARALYVQHPLPGYAPALGPMLFALVLHKLVTSIDADDECFHLLLKAWYLDDDALAGERSAVLRATTH